MEMNENEKNPAAVELGKLGGRVGGRSKSHKKRLASRRNGILGGRPRRVPEPVAPSGGPVSAQIRSS